MSIKKKFWEGSEFCTLKMFPKNCCFTIKNSQAFKTLGSWVGGKGDLEGDQIGKQIHYTSSVASAIIEVYLQDARNII